MNKHDFETTYNNTNLSSQEKAVLRKHYGLPHDESLLPLDDEKAMRKLFLEATNRALQHALTLENSK